MGLWGYVKRIKKLYSSIFFFMNFISVRRAFPRTITLPPYHLIPPSPFPSSSNIIISTLIALLLTSCYENKEGCLDVRSINFSIDADRECDGCCIYPQLKIAFEHKLSASSNTNLTYTDSIYLDGNNNQFRVRDIQFYVSNVRLVREDGSEVYPDDSLQVQLQAPGGIARTANIGDNVALINRSNFTPSEFGTFITTGKFTKVRFTIGLAGNYNQVIPSSLPDSVVNHPLENTTMYVNTDTGFIFNRLQLYNSAIKTDTTYNVFRVLTPHMVNIELALPTTLDVIEGRNVRVTVRINYLKWFEGVNLKSDLSAMVATKIVNNLQNSLSVSAVQLENL